ncbi:hypothetical protein [Lactobacillus taiwanensis]|uniref:hypothetical protein n=2 Tax=Lactobacillus taiwanensis TaxID=508451 RepID=UPI00272CFCBF|nr:hypothetical protein [Lactobacillus taiwanensis]
MTTMIPRQTYIDKLNQLRDKQIVKVLTGVRRSGKLTILQLYLKQQEKQLIMIKESEIY